MNPLVILVSGLPWTGKTSLARRLSEELAIPLFMRDEFKEILFDTLGIKDRDWSRTLGAAAYELLFNALEKELLAGRSVMLESNFSRRAGSKLGEMQEKFGFACARIVCRVDEATRKERFRTRWESWERHPGHVDDLSMGEWGLQDGGSVIPTEGPMIEVDTSDFSKIPYADIIANLRVKWNFRNKNHDPLGRQSKTEAGPSGAARAKHAGVTATDAAHAEELVTAIPPPTSAREPPTARRTSLGSILVTMSATSLRLSSHARSGMTSLALVPYLSV